MEWHSLIQGILGSSPLAAALGFAAWSLWSSNQKKDQEIRDLNAEIRRILLAVSKSSDDD